MLQILLHDAHSLFQKLRAFLVRHLQNSSHGCDSNIRCLHIGWDGFPQVFLREQFDKTINKNTKYLKVLKPEALQPKL